MKKLSKFSLLKKAEVLEEHEMRNVVGGYGYGYGNSEPSYDCVREQGTSFYVFSDVPFSIGVSWCNFWTSAGWGCRCVVRYS